MNHRQVSRISLSPDLVDCIVFWSKNPFPLLSRLKELQSYPFYIQYTITPYGSDLEPHLPSVADSLDTFRTFAERIGPHRVLWRYDPILFTAQYTEDFHLQMFSHMAHVLAGYTDQCTISFLDWYPKIRNQLLKHSIHEPNVQEKRNLAEKLCQTAWQNGIKMVSCAENTDLSGTGIRKGSCIDPHRISSLLSRPVSFFHDKNQRENCGCVESVDIGSYDTCPGGCVYCYANSPGRKRKTIQVSSPFLGSELGSEDIVRDKSAPSGRGSQISFFEEKNL